MKTVEVSGRGLPEPVKFPQFQLVYKGLGTAGGIVLTTLTQYICTVALEGW